MEHRSDIEGLRAVAVLLVVAFHIGIDRFFVRFSMDAFGGGFIGVDVFYVISGFLITALLVREGESSGRISLGRFYSRRLRRLLPAATFVLVATLVASSFLLPPIDLAVVARDGIAAALYGSNIWFGLQATDYLGAGLAESPLLHYWSLSLEEQFYLLWPALLLLGVTVARRREANLRRMLGAIVIAISLPSFVASVLLTPVSAPWAYFGLPTRAWELGMGAGLAFLAPRLQHMRPVISQCCGVVGLAMILGSFALIDSSSLFPGWIAVVPVFGTSLVIACGCAAVQPRTGISTLLGVAPLAYVGRISYSWYLWHWPFITLAGPATGATGRPVAAVVLAAAALSFMAAALTHALVEKPIRSLPSLLVSWRPAGLVIACFAVVAVMAVPMAVLGSDEGSGATTAAGARLDRVRSADACSQDFEDVQAIPCEVGVTESSTTVAIVGDSHAAHMLPAVESAARRSGWRVLLYTKASCPPIDVRRALENYNREYTECSEWRESVWTQLEESNPAMILLSRYGGYGDDLLRADGDEASAAEVQGLWRTGAEATLRRLANVTESVVLLRDVPQPGFDVPACISQRVGDLEGCTYPSYGHVHHDEVLHDAEVAAAEGRDGVFLLDLSNEICDSEPCTVIDDRGVIKFRDTNHLTETFSASLGPVLGERLGEILRNPENPSL